MIRPRKTFLLFLLAVTYFSLVGCSEKTIYPAVLQTVVSVTPYEITPTAISATGTATVTQPSIALRSDSGVPSQLKSYSVAYSTNLGQNIPELRIEETPYDLFLAQNATTNIPVTVYTQRVVDLFSRSTSNISPIRATILLTINDANGNTTQREASCLLYQLR
ncbi:MAG: hypothetical protein HQM09_07080 [Candidatus Riflebacteria bacterium]|nr:hypothetical protein [Candidatus Riflebacteria bacterium]